MDTTWWLHGALSLCWCGKALTEGGGHQRGEWTQRVGFVMTFRLAGAEQSVLEMVVSSWGVNVPTCLMCGRTHGLVWILSVMWKLGVRGQVASADGAHRARPLVRHLLHHWRRHRLRHLLHDRRQRITPVGCAFLECRMQFPRPCVESHIRIVGIATFADTVEHSVNRIACETAPSERSQRARGPASPPPGTNHRQHVAPSTPCLPPPSVVVIVCKRDAIPVA